MTCSNCGKAIKNPIENGYSYGFHNGEPYLISFCKECQSILSEEQQIKILEDEINGTKSGIK